MTLLARCVLTGVLVVMLLLSVRAFAQGTPVPVQTDPGAGRAPIYTQPTSPPVTVEPLPTPLPPAAPASGAPSGPTTPPPAEAEKPPATGAKAGEASTPKTPQPTSFPELTKGVGGSASLLQE